MNNWMQLLRFKKYIFLLKLYEQLAAAATRSPERSRIRAAPAVGGKSNFKSSMPGPLELAAKLRKSGHFGGLRPLRLAEAIPDFTDGGAKELKESKEHPRSGGRESVHLIVMVHGWYGCSHDLRTLRNYMHTLLPDDGTAIRRKYLLATSNEDQSGLATFKKMGENLAAEILAFLASHRISKEALKRVSFVAFSLGGVAARAALSEPCLAPLLSKMHTFLTLGSPHLGFKFGATLIESGAFLFFLSGMGGGLDLGFRAGIQRGLVSSVKHV
ncbi:putative serine esterase-domain-containing protein [Pavlovales sp. CCMP2436]|nr:putative serine esterase-domain-containing protein [Pavlovales sp. CCMP2436]